MTHIICTNTRLQSHTDKWERVRVVCVLFEWAESGWPLSLSLSHLNMKYNNKTQCCQQLRCSPTAARPLADATWARLERNFFQIVQNKKFFFFKYNFCKIYICKNTFLLCAGKYSSQCLVFVAAFAILFAFLAYSLRFRKNSAPPRPRPPTFSW